MFENFDQSLQKIAELELELKKLKLDAAIESQSNRAAMATLNLLLIKAAAKAELVIAVSSQAVIASKQALEFADKPGDELIHLLMENAFKVSEHAAEVAGQTASSVTDLLQTTGVVVAKEPTQEMIKASMIAANEAIKAADVAAEVSRVARSATHEAKAMVYNLHKKTVA